jgi:glutamyl-tRNA synthetase
VRDDGPARPVRGRFAPSPSGLLHLGHAQTMLLCWLQVRALGGALVMRIEDVDSGRTRPGAEQEILRDLAWLGFDWDEGPDVGGPLGPYRQSDCRERYVAARDRLAGRIYPCTCSRKEIRAAAGVDADHRGEVAYPGTCREGPSHPDRDASLRLRVDPGEVGWHDLLLGPMCGEPARLCGDFIVRAKSGDDVYQLACVADDVAQGITHVLRGADLVDSTGRQLLLWRCLADREPLFAHAPLRLDEAGTRLAKSRGSPTIAALRERGDDPRLLLGSLGRQLGLLDSPGEAARPEELLGPFMQRFVGLLRRA